MKAIMKFFVFFFFFKMNRRMQFKEFWEWTIWYASYLDVEFCVGSMKN